MTTTEIRGRCPDWCRDRNRLEGCDGAHWNAGDSITATQGRDGTVPAISTLGVYVHYDREWHYRGRRETEMDQEPHVLLHCMSPDASVDTDARMTADEARSLAGLLLDAASVLDGRW